MTASNWNDIDEPLREFYQVCERLMVAIAQLFGRRASSASLAEMQAAMRMIALQPGTKDRQIARVCLIVNAYLDKLRRYRQRRTRRPRWKDRLRGPLSPTASARLERRIDELLRRYRELLNDFLS